jgi:hypothetical protein
MERVFALDVKKRLPMFVFNPLKLIAASLLSYFMRGTYFDDLVKSGQVSNQRPAGL